jgi:hypothetical protein
MQAGRARLPWKGEQASKTSKAALQESMQGEQGYHQNGASKTALEECEQGDQGCPASWTSKATLQEDEQGEQGYHANRASKAALEGRCSQGPKGGTVGVMHVLNDEALLTMCIRE